MRDALGRMQTVILLGGDSDIGAATVRRMVAGGVRDVVLGGRDPARMERRAEQLRAAGAIRVTVSAFDADTTEAHGAFFDEAWRLLGDVDAVIVAFGVLGGAQAHEQAEEALQVVRTNTLGGMSAVVEAANRMRGQGHGTLVVMSSVAAQRPRRSNFLYGASKRGLDAFAEGLGFGLREQGVQVLVVRPGFVHTKMTRGMKAAPFSTTPDAAARAIVRGIARGDELIWVPGILRWVMFAMDHVPRVIYRRLRF